MLPGGKKFSNSVNEDDYLLKRHSRYLKEIIKTNKLKTTVIEMAIIDIAYNIVFYGAGEEGTLILRDKFKKNYNAFYFYGLLRYIKLKPKMENVLRWAKWKYLLGLDYKLYKKVNLEFYNYRKHLSAAVLSPQAKVLVYTEEFEKYYSGHQHWLGHYFRHLFQVINI